MTSPLLRWCPWRSTPCSAGWLIRSSFLSRVLSLLPPHLCCPQNIVHLAVVSIGFARLLILCNIAVGVLLLLRWTSEMLMILCIHQGRERLHFAVPCLTDTSLVRWRIDPIVAFQYLFFVIEPPPIHWTEGSGIASWLIVASLDVPCIRLVVRRKNSSSQ
jgi:hypothetical protein